MIQRVKSASVTVDGELVSQIGKGLLILAGIGKDDTTKEVESMASKILKVKLWDDDQGGRWKKNVQEIEGEVLCGKYWFRSRFPQLILTSFSSLTVYSLCDYQEGQQTGLPQICPGC